ncbi:MAG: phosphoribosylaminoimidazolesuccinocarboxamide synthase [Candidatus Thermoplasmatota archaeon]|jgi:phosphoribosylaminoimidazole-succinocarboxamide synthase|nr:phosphoribosylaminoimidazolesuccinocarboxamide synthase [Candidatus Thermoplasmatota archaeon]MCL5800860.1 phosphoribosylaminoimidazolesuccinocarboxamide synthase [Candidatus Thermoplasmatota archaeon]
MNSREPVRKGKVKDVYDLGDRLLFKFSDRISVFDKIIPTTVPDKGRSLCRTSTYWFQRLKDRGIKTHFISAKDDEMEVSKFMVREKVDSSVYGGYLIPLEFVVRYYAAGSLMDKLKSGRIDFRKLGLSNMPEYGEKLPDPFFEVTTKFETFDRYLEYSEACEISGLKHWELTDIMESCLRIDRIIESQVARNGLIHADGKKEFALDWDRTPVVVDTFGTLDEDRFWEKSSLDSGKVVELSKEFVRQYYRNSGYHGKLYEMRSGGLKEPDIPPLPAEMVVKVSDLYRSMYERLTGSKW